MEAERPGWPVKLSAALVGVFLLVPTLIVIPMSFSSGRSLEFPPPGWSTSPYESLFSSPTWRSAIEHSVQVGLLSTVLAIVLGVLAAFGIARGRFRGRAFVNGLVISPMIAPIVLVAVGAYFLLTGWELTGTVLGLALAHAALAIPFVVIPVSGVLETLEPRLELAARGLGAGPVRTFQRIVLPQILPAVGAGALFAFVISWDEVVVALFMSSPTFRTVPVEIYTQIKYRVDPTITAMASVLICLSAVGLAASAAALWLRRRRRVG